MRALFSVAVLVASPAMSETLVVTARPDKVTLFPHAALVERHVSVDLPAGVHRIVVPGLPDTLALESLQVVGGEGVRIGTYTLAQGRLPAAQADKPADVLEAEDDVAAKEDVLARQEDVIAGIRARIEAAEARIAYLNRVGADGAPTPEELVATTLAIANTVAAARQDAIAAGAEVRAAEVARKDAEQALTLAREALAALVAERDASLTLTVDLTKETAERGTLVLTTMAEDGFWAPVYDLFLTRGDAAPGLSMERGVVVSQDSGEDWLGVDLTLSTARVTNQTSPYPLGPTLVSMESEADRDRREALAQAVEGQIGGYAAPEAEPVMEADRSAYASLELVGDVVTYHYPGPVDLRSGVDQLRLSLDRLELVPEVFARAVPQMDTSAYLMADLTNESDEILLPGIAFVHVDGALKGMAEFPMIPPGDHAEIGFGGIDGITVTRTVLNRSEGERGIISSTNQRDESVTIELRNLTGEGWPLRVVDRIPFSEQDGLVVSSSAAPAADRSDVDGKRGVLEWDVDLGPGQTQEIRIETTLKWPDGMVLR